MTNDNVTVGEIRKILEHNLDKKIKIMSDKIKAGDIVDAQFDFTKIVEDGEKLQLLKNWAGLPALYRILSS